MTGQFVPPMYGFARRGFSLAVAHDASPYVSAYPWNELGFGTKHADNSGVPGNASAVAYSLDGGFIAVAHSTSPFITVCPWTSSGFVTKVSDPATLPASRPTALAFAPDSSSLATAVGTLVRVYAWSSSGFGAALDTVSPGGNVLGVTYSPNGDYIAVAHSSSPYVSIYPWSGTAFSAKVSDPATLPTGAGYAVAFSPAANAVVVAHASSPYVSAYPWSGGAFGSKYSNPATLPAYDSYAVTFSPDGNYVAVTGAIGASGPFPPTDYFSVYPWSAGFGTKVSSPEQATSAGTGVAFSPRGDFIAFTYQSTGGVSVYPWSAGTFGAKCTAPAVAPTGSCNGIAFNRATV